MKGKEETKRAVDPLLSLIDGNTKGRKEEENMKSRSGGPLCSQYIRFLNHSILQPQSHTLDIIHYTLISQSFT